jgi:menaquinone-dependent protoporphyrinogen oxidase
METKKGINRRQFLITGATIVGASALCMTGAGLAIQEPDIDYYASISDVSGSNKKNVLVAYATRAGSTGETAGVIGNILSESGYSVDVKPVDDIQDLSGYQAVVLGGAIRASAWLPEAVEFVKTHQQALSKVPVAYFTCSITVINPDTESVAQETKAFLDPVLQEVPLVKPVAVEHLAGVLDFDKLPIAYRLIWPLTPGGKVKQGDYRDWDVIKSWASSLVAIIA